MLKIYSKKNIILSMENTSFVQNTIYR